MSPAVHTRLYLVRHCDVRNPDGVLYGHLPDFPLSEKGRRQAHILGEHFAGASVRRIYTSPLERARETADVIASHLDGAPVIETDDLIEARFGRYLQGVRPRDVPWRRPLWFVHMAWPGLLGRDESIGTMTARVRRPLRRLLEDFPGESGICISHGDPIQAFWVEHDRRPPFALHRLQCAKGGLLELDYEDGTLRTITYRSPRSLGEPEAASPAIDASHA
ncbi:MAG: histidine phosphatase family protein [Chloroflexi bacterium]|nr:MAG: histidine phosphatase family protein [Chloroflexota bacterium]